MINKNPIQIVERRKSCSYPLGKRECALPNSGGFRFDALLGLIKLEDDHFLLLVTKSTCVGSVYEDHTSGIFKLTEVQFVSFTHGTNYGKLKGKMRTALDGIAKVLSQGFYFSYHYNLTTSMQRSPRASATLYDRADPQYTWNQSLTKEFVAQTVSTRWLVPIIQGYVGIAHDDLNGKKLKLILISRRSHRRAGTRFKARGIDDDGNVANLVETEQIVLYNGYVYSNVQLRGSVPVFWTQTGVTATVRLTKTAELAFPAFSRHFDGLVQCYKHVLIFNLLAAKKEWEAELTKAYEFNAALYEQKAGAEIKYCYFDFHHERKSPVHTICHSIDRRCRQSLDRELEQGAGVLRVLQKRRSVSRTDGCCEDQLPR